MRSAAYPRRVTVEGVLLTGADLTIEDVEAVARHGAAATLDAAARARMARSRAVVDALVAEGAVVYGVTTGVGAMADRLIDPADAERLQENLLVSHAAGVGEPLPRDVVRAMLLLRANTLALGYSGARPEVAERLLDFLRLGIHPVDPGAGLGRRVGGPGAARPPRAAAHRAGAGGARRARDSVDGRAARDRAGADAARGQGGPRDPQWHAADDGAGGAAGRRCAAARRDRERRGRDVGRGPARHGRGLRRGLPGGAAASGPGRGRGRAALPAPRQRRPAVPPRIAAQGPGPVLAALRAPGPRRGPGRARHTWRASSRSR